ncbi:hypothetical protein [Bradyrhizobium macuxiense]|uniref:hypothetical protein n=1 Tax=Bradyrhizobium macuxiense TaxID=1755647 RepID=UPI0011BD7B7F|nr:hypothetical protein [Bradyrhizobium macuxiense]
MVTRPEHSSSFWLFGNLISRLRTILARQSELACLSRQDIDAIARELRLSTSEFRALAQRPGAPELLSKRLALAGLSEKAFAAHHGDVLHDLQRVCGLCQSKRRCAAELNQEKHASPPKWCPNEQTLRALNREAASHARRFLD